MTDEQTINAMLDGKSDERHRMLKPELAATRRALLEGGFELDDEADHSYILRAEECTVRVQYPIPDLFDADGPVEGMARIDIWVQHHGWIALEAEVEGEVSG